MLHEEKVYNLIGRFQIAHAVHAQLFQHGINNSDHLVIQVGSSEVARDEKNPFTFEERKQVIEAICEPMLADHREHGRSKKLSILPLHDYTYDNNKWLTEAQANVASVTKSNNITLTGSKKDATSSYLEMFPQWGNDFIEVVPGVGATQVREQFFETGTISRGLPAPTQEFMSKFMRRHNGKSFALLQDEYNFNKNERAKYDCMPFPPVFVTGDAIVVCAGHILLVERGQVPGLGCWAMPGGYFDTGMRRNKETGKFEMGDVYDTDPVAAALRELKEETKIAKGVMKGAIRNTMVFADPYRSRRGRIITHATHIQLKDTELPKVKGGDDAKKAFWLPLAELEQNRSKFFEDHLSIIDTFLGVL